jgi:ethanolamine utilization protein EutQ (cupin superfamily)
MKTIHHTLDTRILIKTTVKYVREKIRKRLEIDQFDDESINQNNKKSFNEKFNAENQFNRESFSESDNNDAENSIEISIFETFTSEKAFYKLVNC